MTTVLIVEDDPINFRVFAKILTKRGGLEVKGTEDVEEVLRIARDKEADVILMDVSLSHSVYEGKAVDGIKISQILKANPETADLPVILVTFTRYSRHCSRYGRRSREFSQAESGRWLYF